jgi:hypothetical protein
MAPHARARARLRARRDALGVFFLDAHCVLQQTSRTRSPATPRPRRSLARVLTFRAPALQPQRRSNFARGRPRARLVPGGLHVPEDGSGERQQHQTRVQPARPMTPPSR